MSAGAGISVEWPSCPTCGRTVNAVALEWGKRQEDEPLKPARWWAKPCCCPLTVEQHAALGKALRPRWRFDVPEVPAHVTCMTAEGPDGGGTVWVRLDDTDRWAIWDYKRHRRFSHSIHIREVAQGAPLVECEDPRAAS